MSSCKGPDADLAGDDGRAREVPVVGKDKGDENGRMLMSCTIISILLLTPSWFGRQRCMAGKVERQTASCARSLTRLTSDQ
jgi:hypothetical protein